MEKRAQTQAMLLAALTVAVLLIMAIYDYLLFHALIELFSVVVSMGIAFLIWFTRKDVKSEYLKFLGVAFLFIGWFDLIHMFSYKGMAIFSAKSQDVPTQLLLVARYLQSITFVAALVADRRRLRLSWIFAAYTAVTALLTWLILFTPYFPTAYVEGVGQTQFKMGSEYLIALIYGGALMIMQNQRDRLGDELYRLQVWSIALAISAELFLTVYVDIEALSNVFGHLLKGASFALIYLSIVKAGILQPLQEERDFNTAIVDHSAASVIVIDNEGHILRFNRAAEQLTGYRAEEVMGADAVSLLIPPEEDEDVRVNQRNVAATSGYSAGENHYVTKSGERRLVSRIYSTVRGADGSVAYIVVSGRDVTEERRLAERLREREEKLRLLVQQPEIGMLLIDSHTRSVTLANSAALDLLGLAADQVIGQCCDRLVCTCRDGICPFLEGRVTAKRAEFVVTRPDGSTLPVLVMAHAATLADKPFVIQSFIDITDHKKLEGELRTLSLTDDLTGVYNRRGFLTLAELQIAATGRNGGRYAVLFIDMRGRRQINDESGHIAGDSAMVDLAYVLRHTFRESDLIARIGGGEFAVLCLNTDQSTVELLTERLRVNLDSYNQAAGRGYQLGVTLGATFRAGGSLATVEQLLIEADRNMYARMREQEAAAGLAGEGPESVGG